MHLGYIHFDRAEQKKYLAVISRLSQGGALDELGVGRIRDYYSDTMFPGVSSLQQHAKYFVVLPLLYREASHYSYTKLSEVRPKIIQLEKELTEYLFNNSSIKTGITGSEFIGQKGYVKYDPSYIYNSGLYKFGILRNDNVEEMIFQASKQYHERPIKLQSSDNNQGDSQDQPDNFQFFSIPTNHKSNWIQSCSLDLTIDEAQFLKDHITTSKVCKNSLLAHILNNNIPVDDTETFEAFTLLHAKSLPEQLYKTTINAKYFAELVDGLFYYYNFLFSNKTDDAIYSRFQQWRTEKFLPDKNLMRQSTPGLKFHDKDSTSFCHSAINLIEEEKYTELDELIIRRESTIKNSRHKINNSNYEYNPKSPIHDYTIQFRWTTVRTIILEINKGLKNG